MEISIQKKTVLIIGAGIAGLRAAKELQKNDIQYLIIEKEDKPGGRIKTVEKEGFLLDMGFQVLLNSYDEIGSAFEITTLHTKPFDSGAIVTSNAIKKYLFNPLKHPEKMISTIFSHPGNWSDLFKTIAVSWKAGNTNADFFKEKQTSTTAEFLLYQKFSKDFIDGFFKPFFGGVFLDSELSPSSNYFLWLLDKFRIGSACLPAKGMGEIGTLMAKDLANILYGEKVAKIEVNTAFLETGKQIEAEWIINATGKQDLIFNTESSNQREFRGATTLYLKAEKQPELSKSIVLIGDSESPVLHFSFPSEVQKLYAPEGYCLCSVSIKWKGITEDHENLATSILIELSKHYPSINWQEFSYLAHFDIPYALPKWQSGNKQTFLVDKNRITIGDHVAYPSINGALRSGREAAEYVIKKIKE